MLYALRLPQHSGKFVSKCGGWGKYHQYCFANGLAKPGPDGMIVPIYTPITSNKTPRNAPCPCGSKKKFKKCCY